MIKEFSGINISTKDPEMLVKFYNEKLGIPIVKEGFGNYDGAELGFDKDAPVIYIWDEELKLNGVELNPPITAEWGGKELKVVDPEGNKLTLL